MSFWHRLKKATGDLAVHLINSDKYSDKIRNIIQSLGLDSMLGSEEISQFLSHIRRSYKPRLTAETATMVKNYFLSLKSKFSPGEVLFPLSIRSLESIIRLCQARAKLSCRNVVMPSDVEEIKDLYSQIIAQTVSVDKEAVRKKNEVDRSDVSNLSLPKQVKVFIEVLNDECRYKPDRIFTMGQLREIAKSMRMRVGEFYTFIEKLNLDGHFLKKGGDTYCLLTNTDL